MVRIIVWSLLFAIIFSSLNGYYELTPPICGWGLVHHANRGFPIQYADGFQIKKPIKKTPGMVLCTAGYIDNSSFRYSYRLQVAPDLGIYPILYLANTSVYFLFFASIGVLLRKHKRFFTRFKI